MSFSVHFDNKKKYILILSEALTQGLDDATLTAEKKYQLISLWLDRLWGITMGKIIIYFSIAKNLVTSKQKILKSLPLHYL